MAAKVIARHRVWDALDPVSNLGDDDVARIQAAAERASYGCLLPERELGSQLRRMTGQ